MQMYSCTYKYLLIFVNSRYLLEVLVNNAVLRICIFGSNCLWIEHRRNAAEDVFIENCLICTPSVVCQGKLSLLVFIWANECSCTSGKASAVSPPKNTEVCEISSTQTWVLLRHTISTPHFVRSSSGQQFFSLPSRPITQLSTHRTRPPGIKCIDETILFPIRVL